MNDIFIESFEICFIYIKYTRILFYKSKLLRLFEERYLFINENIRTSSSIFFLSKITVILKIRQKYYIVKKKAINNINEKFLKGSFNICYD